MTTIRRGLVLLLALVIALSSVETVESSKLKRTRRSIENAEDSESNRRRLSMADDVFTTTGKEYEVVGYHRAIGATVIRIIGKVFVGIGSIFKFIGSALGGKAVVAEPEAEPATMMSSIYDSISSAMSSNSTSTPTKTVGTKPVTKSAPLRTTKTTIPKTTSRGGGALGKRSIMEDLVKSGPSGLFDDIQDTGVTIVEKIQSYLPDTSKLAKLLPTLVAGLVFTTAGSIVGYLYNSELAATASSYVNYYILGEEGEVTAEADSFYDAATSTSSTESHEENFASTPAVPVTPGRF
eukprot:CAMPEP_0116142894 /NCGR_PEP_ID=MMETSP0329-20121206/15153_1 /TAXON_ID=697910 /ORGANISM="Pseudo-nitzschia arenysensis, Strain B593" /LENGTH=293 /DNA_ID=CAMNT_0003638163 /DNA_START=68 /DNA_END=949 /DNA_ORIENTATION=-